MQRIALDFAHFPCFLSFFLAGRNLYLCDYSGYNWKVVDAADVNASVNFEVETLTQVVLCCLVFSKARSSISAVIGFMLLCLYGNVVSRSVCEQPTLYTTRSLNTVLFNCYVSFVFIFILSEIY